MRNPATADDMPGGFLTQKHSAQIDTPTFKRWFNGSVIVDAYGGPRIMYHGTVWTDIGKFESYRAQKGIAGFFAFDPEFASQFAKMYAEEYENEGVRKAPVVYPVYLSLKKVFDVRKKEDRDEVGWTAEPSFNGWDWGELEEPDNIAKMKKAGFDGYIDFEMGSNKPPTGIAVFDPRNIKSAIGNRGTFDPTDPDIRNPYTKPDLRERLKRKIMAGDKGGRPGQWSARKAQLLAAEYEKAGGGYSGKRTASQRSLSKWAKQDWRTKSGKPSLETGERYLPAAAITALTSAEYAETSRAKRKATGQFSRQPKRIAEKTSRYRKNPDDTNHPMTSRVHYRLNPDSKGKGMNTVRSKLSQIIEPGDRILCYDTAKGEDFYRLWDIIHTALPLTEEALTEIEGMLDDDGVLVIESGETPAGLQDHFRKATRYNGLLLVQGPKDPEGARIKTEELRRELE